MRRSLLTTVLLLATSAPASVLAQQNVVSQESNLNTSNGVLSGTFLVPDLPTPMPVVLIIAGSGPTDRDGNSTMLSGKNNAYRLLAEALAARGIASLRYDKRGVGKSAKVGQKEADLRFEDYVNDAANIADILRGDARFSTVTIAGHSEGSLIGMIATRVSEADAFVSIAGVAQGAAGIIRAQLQPQLGNIPALWDASQSVLASLEAGQTIAPPPALAGVPALASLFRPSVQPYLISWFKYVPSAEIAKLTVPGTADPRYDGPAGDRGGSRGPQDGHAEGDGGNRARHEPRHEGGGGRSGQAGRVVWRPLIADCARGARRDRRVDPRSAQQTGTDVALALGRGIACWLLAIGY